MIESLHSPHVARVKALLSSKREREAAKLFVAEGMQALREASSIETLYLSKSGAERIEKAGIDISGINVLEVNDRVADAMSDAITTQGIIALCPIEEIDLSSIARAKNIIYLNEIQDPGNAGTILRTADAMGIDAVVTSPGSVDFYSPKVVRSTAGSLWHVTLIQNVEWSQVKSILPKSKYYLLDGASAHSLDEIDFSNPAIWIFGNEARGLKSEVEGAIRISIEMPGRAESLNLAAAAAIVMHEIARKR